eukprot:7096706-Karenia_brevis.AAC.1
MESPCQSPGLGIPGNHLGSQSKSLELPSLSPGLGIPGNHLGSQSSQRICCPQMVALAVPPHDKSAILDATLAKASQILSCSPSLQTVEKMMNEIHQILINLKTSTDAARDDEDAAAAADDPEVP